MIDVDTEELKQLVSDLKTFKARAYPFATKFTVNSAAFQARDRTLAAMDKKQILRNKPFIRKSVQVVTARTLRVSQQEARMGGVPDFMEDQEFGGIKRRKGKFGVPLATSVVSGEGRGARPRKKVPRAALRLSKIKFTKKSKKKFKSRRQEIFVQTLLAIQAGQRFIFLDTGERQAIYGIRGRGKLDRNGRITGVKMEMLYDLSEDDVPIPRTPTFAPATIATQKQIPAIYLRAVIFQLKRHGLFKD